MNNIITALQLRILQEENVTEEDVRQSINNAIVKNLKEKHNQEITFRNEVKTSINRFIDSKYGHFIIEYKKPSVNLGNKERGQLLSYLMDKKYFTKHNWGMLTNGKDVEIYNYNYEKYSFELNDDYSGKLNESQINYITNILANKDNLILTKENVNDILGLENHKEIIRIMHQFLLDSTNNRTKLLYDEWLKLFNLSDEYDHLSESKKQPVIKFYETLLNKPIRNITDEHKALFTIQTFYAIMLKLMTYKIIINKTSSRFAKPTIIKNMFKDIENNKFFRKNNITNLIDGDFFSWYLSEFSEVEFEYFYNVIEPIVTIDTKGLNLLFITYYENIFPFNVRYSMGEFYTPSYLANQIVNNGLDLLEDKENVKALDPSCGSGIFIINAFNNGIKDISGIDINPLAVLTSKINFLINNFDLSKPIEIPIYLGDSAYSPQEILVNGVKSYKYSLYTSVEKFPEIKFLFPEDLIVHEDFFKLLDVIEEHIVNFNKETIIKLLRSIPEAHYIELESDYDKLIEELFTLERLGLNSIWLKIIANYFKSGVIKNVDFIVGNPPWVRWSNLPEYYKKTIKDNCRIEGLFSGDSNSGGVDLNICALLSYVLIRDRLSQNGVLGFIMPDSMLFNKSFEGFRNMKFNDGRMFYLNKVIRWNDPRERPFDPVTLDFSEYYFSFNEMDKTHVFDRKKDKEMAAFKITDSFNNHYVITEKEHVESIKGVLGRNNYRFRSGIGLIKGGHYLLEFDSKIDDKHSWFIPHESNGTRIVLSNKKIKLEHEIVYPYIKTTHVNNGYIRSTELFALFPYPFGEKTPYSLEIIKERYPYFYDYFMSREVQKSIATASSYNKRIQNNKDLDIGIFRVGEYTYNDIFVITRDNSKPDFSIIEYLNTPWGEKKMPLFDGHINFVSRDLDGKPLSKPLAEKLFKSFNRDGVKHYIEASSDSRSISSRLYNDIKIID